MNNICRDFINKRCRRHNCRYIHDKDICFKWVKKQCNDNNCKWNHFINSALNNSENFRNASKKRKPKNTTDFTPNHNKAELRIVVSPITMKSYTKNIYPRDIILADGLFCQTDDFTIYNNLIQELQEYEKINNRQMFKPWHGNNHLIADDKLGWKKNAPTFHTIINKIQSFFNMDIKATRFNWYRNQNEWKPFHHDAAAIDPKKASLQNFTVGVSFGTTRDIAFQDIETNKVITIPMMNGQMYAFSRDVNIEWKHGIPQVHPDKQLHDSCGRISIIAWGSVTLTEFD